METEIKFTHTIFGKLLRWLIFIPVGLILMFILDLLLLTFLNWIFENDLKKFVIIGIFLGGLFTIIPLSYVFYNGIGKLVASIAPNPKLASFIFSAIIILILINSIYNWRIINLPNFWVASIMQSLTTLFVIFGLFSFDE